MNEKAPLLLTIIDGWGQASLNEEHNPFKFANTPTIDDLLRSCPNTLLDSSGQEIGLPVGQMGNSEVGHMAIGSGRRILQSLPRITQDIEQNKLQDNKTLLRFIERIKVQNNICHLVGLFSDGGIHSHLDHIIWLAQFLAAQNCTVMVHAITDGRDSDIMSRAKYIQYFQSKVTDKRVMIATISGRYFAMDRDQRWERTSLYYDALVRGQGLNFRSYVDCFDHHHSQNITDEFFLPSVLGDYTGIDKNDCILMANFRADRIRQILDALLSPNFTYFPVIDDLNLFALAMTECSQELNSVMSILYNNTPLNNTLPDILNRQNMTQLRISETEKYAHVTFFFNGGREQPYELEKRILIQSPRVATYDLQPEMSAFEITDVLVSEMGKYDFTVLNFANFDMVGHTGNFESAIRAIESIDLCLKRIKDFITSINGTWIITSDHGNIESMKQSDGSSHTQHTTNQVPFILFSKTLKNTRLAKGSLIDIAPTILHLFDIAIPPEMDGKSLICLESI